MADSKGHVAESPKDTVQAEKLATPIRSPNLHTHKPISQNLNMSSDPSKTTSTMQNTMGKVQEAVGNVTGLDSMKTSGQERRVQGDAEYKQAQTQGYTEGLKDRAFGKKDQVAGTVSGDTSQEVSGRARNEQGKTQQDMNQS